MTLSMADRFLTSSQQHNCSIISRGDCVAYTNCILSNLDDYVKAGMSSGTQLLTLIPAALAILPTRGPDVLAAWAFGWPFLVLSAFAGSIPVGAAGGELARMLGQGAGSQSTQAILNAWTERFNKHDALRYPTFSLLARTALHITAGMLGSVPIFLAIMFGPSMVVTWCCDLKFMMLSWIIGRMSPPLAEWAVLWSVHRWMVASAAQEKAERGQFRIRTVHFVALSAQILVKGLNGFVIIWGKSV